MKCMADGLPVGVLMQVKPKPGVEYRVLGLAMVTEWKDGYFILEGFTPVGTRSRREAEPDAAYDRARVATASRPEGDFDPLDLQDLRERQIAEVVRRRGQAAFRKALLDAYGGRCYITGCDAVEALEAAHITPYRGEQTNHPQNGLLLRADIHSLFDLGLIAVEPESGKVVLSPALASGSYSGLRGVQIASPDSEAMQPSREALQQHLEWTRVTGAASMTREL